MKSITLTWDELEKMKPNRGRYGFQDGSYYIERLIKQLQQRILDDEDDYTARVQEQAKRAGFEMPKEVMARLGYLGYITWRRIVVAVVTFGIGIAI